MQRQIFYRVLELLESAGLLVGVTEEQIQEALADDHLISALARLFYSEERSCLRRFVFYDAECLYEDDDLIRLVNKFVEATDGEWAPRNLQAHWDGLQANIAFAFNGQHISWTFQQQSDWVDCEFYARLEEFTRHYLSGIFVDIPTRDQCACHLYLPRSIATEVAFLALLDGEPELDHALFMNMFAAVQGLGWLAEVSFARLVCCTGLTQFLEELLPGHTICLYRWSESSLQALRDGGYYEDVVGGLARLTGGEWNPQHLHWSDNEERQGLNIVFDFRNRHFTWLLAPSSGNVAEILNAYLTMFARDYLSGDFVELRIEDKGSIYLYLPRAVAGKL